MSDIDSNMTLDADIAPIRRPGELPHIHVYYKSLSTMPGYDASAFDDEGGLYKVKITPIERNAFHLSQSGVKLAMHYSKIDFPELPEEHELRFGFKGVKNVVIFKTTYVLRKIARSKKTRKIHKRKNPKKDKRVKNVIHK